MSTGLFFLKGAPLTKGHVHAITIAASQVEQLYVVLCWDEKFQKQLSPIQQKVQTRKNRERWLLETFKHMPYVHICSIDETNIPAYPHGEVEFTNILRNEILDKFNCTYFDKVFSSEPSYRSYFERNIPEAEIVLIDPERKAVDISATKIRNDVYGNWEYLSKAAQKDYIKKVVIIGVESTAKSTLTINLANHFGTNFVEEVGRTVCEKEFFRENLMTAADYEYIAMQHKCKEHELIKESNKVLFSDTNNLITYFSAVCTNNESPLLEQMSKDEKYDLVILLDSNVKWVSDPLRLNGDPNKRKEVTILLADICDKFEVPYVKVSGNYKERYEKCIELVNDLLLPENN